MHNFDSFESLAYNSFNSCRDSRLRVESSFMHSTHSSHSLTIHSIPVESSIIYIYSCIRDFSSHSLTIHLIELLASCVFRRVSRLQLIQNFQYHAFMTFHVTVLRVFSNFSNKLFQETNCAAKLCQDSSHSLTIHWFPSESCVRLIRLRLIQFLQSHKFESLP